MIRRPVDIIIPVYKGYEVTRACIESVLASENTIETNVYVINDASPEPELNAYLVWLSENAPVTVLHNTSNMGFPKTINKGFALNPDHDVIILNSDTLVFSDWVDRMARAAYSSHDIGTVTPFSNNATICSYPFINKDNPHTTDISPGELDSIFKRLNAGGICELPTGVGFCMYFRRECLDDVGDFDEENFDCGYGEENDFCIKGNKNGWKNVLAADVYIFHAGGRSFESSRKRKLEKNLATLTQKYPYYIKTIINHVQSDAQMRFRRTIDEEIATRCTERHIIIRICHNFGGGTEKRLRDEASELTAQGAIVATILPAGSHLKNQVKLTYENTPDCQNLLYDLSTEIEDLVRQLNRHKVIKIIVHHYIGLHVRIFEIPKMLHVSYEIVIHDYAWYCPQINMINFTGRNCEDPDEEFCQRCIDMCSQEFEENLPIYQIAARSKQIMRGACRVITPCEDTAYRIRKRFDLDNLQVIPHEIEVLPERKTTPLDGTSRIRVAVIGGIGKHKGYDLLLKCARDAVARNLPLEFYVIGTTLNDMKLLCTGRVMISGKYDEKEHLDLICRSKCHASLFLSLWPETWCYALSCALKAGLPVVSLDNGALGERLSKNQNAYLLDSDSDFTTINNHILSLKPKHYETEKKATT